jgi:hypothetical protein
MTRDTEHYIYYLKPVELIIVANLTATLIIVPEANRIVSIKKWESSANLFKKTEIKRE